MFYLQILTKRPFCWIFKPGPHSNKGFGPNSLKMSNKYLYKKNHNSKNIILMFWCWGLQSPVKSVCSETKLSRCISQKSHGVSQPYVSQHKNHNVDICDTEGRLCLTTHSCNRSLCSALLLVDVQGLILGTCRAPCNRHHAWPPVVLVTSPPPQCSSVRHFISSSGWTWAPSRIVQ